MTKTNKITLLVALGIVFILAVALIAVGPTAFAATAEEPSGYYFKVDGQVVENNTIQLKRGTTTGEITFWYDGEQQEVTFMIMPQTPAEKYLTLHNSTVSASADAPLSYTAADTPYIVCLSSNGINYLYIQIIPNDVVKLYNMGDGELTFSVLGVNDIQTIDGTTEAVWLTVNVTNSVGGSQTDSSKITSSEDLVKLSGTGYFLSGRLSIEVASLKYIYGSQSITYSLEDYPQLFGVTSTYAHTYFEGGNGTAADPYTLTNATQFDNMRKLSQYDGKIADYALTKHFKMISNINMSGLIFEPIHGQFQGTFDGNNYTLQNFQTSTDVYSNACYGIFETIAKTGIVKNLTMENVLIRAITDYSVKVGAIAGYNYGTITNCTVSGRLYAKYQQSDVGGIAAFNAGGTISYCTNEAEVEGCGSVGGIVGTNSLGVTSSGISSGGTVNDCINKGTVTLNMRSEDNTYYTGDAGGIVGMNTNESNINYCSNFGEIVYGGPRNIKTSIKPNMAQIVGWLKSGTQQNNAIGGTVDYSLLTSYQKGNCKSSAVGKEGE